MASSSYASEKVLELVLGLVDPQFYGRGLRLANDGIKTATAVVEYNTLPMDLITGYPSPVTCVQNVNNLSQNLVLQLPVRTPPTTLFVARFRSATLAFIIEDKNVTGASATYLLFDEIGDSAMQIDLFSTVSARAYASYGGATYYQGYFNPTGFGTTSGLFASTAKINTVGDNATGPPIATTTWQGFKSWRAPHGPLQAAQDPSKKGLPGNRARYIYCDGSPWAQPGFPQYLSTRTGPAPKTGTGIAGYVCDCALALPTGWQTNTTVQTLDGNGYGPVNYDEVFYLFSGCIIVCVPPLIASNDPRIIPGGVQFMIRVFKWKAGTEKLVARTPDGAQTLSNMQPKDPLAIIPIWERGSYRVEFTLSNADGIGSIPCGNYAYSVVFNSLSEFMGHHMLPQLLSNVDTNFDPTNPTPARATMYPESTQENVAYVFEDYGNQNLFPKATVNGNAYNYSPEYTPDQVTVSSARINGCTLKVVEQDTNGSSTSSAATGKIPAYLDWLEVLDKDRFEDNPLVPFPAYSDKGQYDQNYSSPFENLNNKVSTVEETTLKEGKFFAHYPISGIEDIELLKEISPCRRGQIKAGVALNFNELVSFFSFTHTLWHPSCVITVFQTSPTAVQFSTGATQANAVANTSPIDLRLSLTFGIEYTTLDKFRTVLSSRMTREEVETAATLIAQLPVSASGSDYLKTLFSRFPDTLSSRLLHYLKTGVEDRTWATKI